MIKYSAAVNGVEVSAEYTERSVSGVFMPLLRRLRELRQDKGGRVLALMAAPPGAGKSTLAGFLERLSSGDLQAVGMDGFHRRQDDLASHFTTDDRGGRIPLSSIKGAPVTFDLVRLADRLARISRGERCGWPEYSRSLHNPVEDAVVVKGDIVLIEGNYLLLDEEGWRELKTFADYTISISADEDLLRRRLIDRKLRAGMAREEAIRFVDDSDMRNVRLCLAKTLPADLRLWTDGTDFIEINPRRAG